MDKLETDVLVAGGGIAGLSVAARLAAAGHRVLCADPKPEASDPAAEASADRRTTAFLMPSMESFRRAGAWPRMAPEATPLAEMRIVSAEGGSGMAAGAAPVTRAEAGFAARELGSDTPFGFNIRNMIARAALAEALQDSPHGQLASGVSVERVIPRRDDAVARLSDGRRVNARLVIAADGRDSQLRDAAGIPVRRWAHPQKALVLTITHPEPHDGVSTEFHRPGGPLVLVPLPNIGGQPASSVVWVNSPERADTLMAMEDGALSAALTAETMGRFGALTLAGKRAVWPVISQIALRLDGERLALVGEPAHVVPPTGAQGANLSIADGEALASLVAERAAAGGDIGAPDLLSAYSRARMPDIALRVGGTELLNRIAHTANAPLIGLRSLGVGAIARVPALRRALMRTGLGG
ncbi:MAG: FAD-dependent oxidoreductase [Pseudomonadota bacterium]